MNRTGISWQCVIHLELTDVLMSVQMHNRMIISFYLSCKIENLFGAKIETGREISAFQIYEIFYLYYLLNYSVSNYLVSLSKSTYLSILQKENKEQT